MIEKIAKKNYKYILLLILGIGIFLRFIYLPNRNINFGYDQARDAFAVQEITKGHLKILGPPINSNPNIFQGVLFYYEVAPAYYLGHGDPLYAAFFLALINALAVIPVFILTFLLTKKRAVAQIAALLFAVSFDALQFSDFISNVSPAILFIPCILIGLYLWINKTSKWGPVITGIALGLSVQSEIAFLYYFLPIIFWLFIYRSKIKRKDMMVFGISFILLISSIILGEIKFGFQGIKSLFGTFQRSGLAHSNFNFGIYVVEYLKQLGGRLAFSIFPINLYFGEIVGFLIIVQSFIFQSKRNNFSWVFYLASFIFASFFVQPFGGLTSPYIMIGVIPLLAVFISIFLYSLFAKKVYLLALFIGIMVFVNLTKFITTQQSTHPDYFTDEYLLKNEMNIVDYSYNAAQHEPFSISTLTMPLFINTTWSYLYNWYGEGKYGYLPFWIGRDQIGQPGNNLIKPPDSVLKHFFIVEPVNQIPSQWVIYAYGDQNSISRLIEEKSFGGIIVQKRVLKTK